MSTTKRRPPPTLMWAAVVHGKRSSWIQPDTVSYTRREARRKYEAFWDPAFAPRAVKEHGITFARVVVVTHEEWEQRA